MSQRNRMSSRRQKPRSATLPAATRPVWEKKPPVHYGKPFIVLEDEHKKTFVFQSGVWIAHSMSIAECRQTCQVKELPQKVNGMVRFEVRSPTTMSS